MAYEKRDNSGSLFKNDKKDKPNQPDWKGDIMIDGTEYWLSGWVKNGKNGKFFSLATTPKGQQTQKSESPDDSDDIPW